MAVLERLNSMPDSMAGCNPNLILAVVCSAMFLDLANLSAITIALPTIQENFDVDAGNLQWMISAYSLTFGGFLLIGGRGGDIFGHRRVLLFGMVFFALFSLVCALSPTFIGLVIARAFQGIGAAFTIPPAQAHVALYFTEPAKKAKALGIWGAAGSLGFIIGLILGGVLTAFLGWRWIFWISLIISSLVIPAAYLILPRPRSSRGATPPPSDSASPDVPTDAAQKKFLHSLRERLIRFDALGIALGVPGILLLTYALTSANATGWAAPSIIATLCASVVLLALFVAHERTASQAILAPHLFRSRSFDLTLVLAVLTYAVRQACTYFLTVQLQRSFGYSAIRTSVLFIPLGVSALVCNTLSGRLVPVLGARVMFILGWTLSIPGIALFATTNTHSYSYQHTTLPGTILYIAGIGAVYIAASVVVVSQASRSDQGAAAGVFNVALQVGGSVLGLAVLTAVAEGVGGGGEGPGGGIGEEGFKAVYWACVGLCGVGLVVSVFAIEVPEGLRGSVWERKGKKGGPAPAVVDAAAEAAPVVEGTTGASSVASSSHELQPVVRETRED
ncbi:Puromycin resistance protein pur8 [Lasiodiplodia hormozganensis]|uniref:Puromycin resistance protein pur8 n=1 Tax=Lasiodiplodia hormozganensis TaxID=869390 RepID=A0AA39Z475_9PEZI|nr:Puromycin resistance protein pur8 [Lasiodiplodia hormozganensis]